MFQMKVGDAMRMNHTHRDHLNQSLSMAHDPVLGIVTIDSLRKANEPDTSAIADNPPVAGAAGASDPTIAEAVRGIRKNALPIVSADRARAASGKTDEMELDNTKPRSAMLSTMAARARARGRK